MSDWEDQIPDELRVEIDRDEVRTEGLPLDVKCERQRVPSGAVVYFLCRGDEIVYIGSSKNIYARIGNHQHDKWFDSWAYVEVRDMDLARAIERNLIHAVDPPYNDMSSETGRQPDLVDPVGYIEYLREQRDNLPR